MVISIVREMYGSARRGGGGGEGWRGGVEGRGGGDELSLKYMQHAAAPLKI